ncbi:secreted antigen 1 [Babesia divergens]|uniref:Secreted antigen 1 n=1 Tax=Babesia divergens TaxID=32595 RepID=A0AAD9LIE7_BABDI|nr:secreted antigen 1 [Babesia divergens]
MSETKVPCDFEDPGSLKDILEELGKLYTTTSTRHKVFLQLKSYLEPYCGNGYLQAFYKDLVEGSDHRLGVSSYGSGSILLLTQAAERISEAILKSTPSWSSSYSDPHSKHEGQTCGEKYFNALQACLPKAYAALFFLFFNVSTECSGIGGGSWNSYSVKGSGNSLYQWLTEEDSSGLIPKKFSGGELHPSNKGQNVAEKLKSAVSLKPNTYSGSLQNVLCGFMFVCSWDDALTGHACLFLSTFCSKVLEGSESLLQGKYKEHSGAFKDVCRDLKTSLQPFIVGSSGLSAVCHDNTNLFDSLWDNGKFLTYCDWLKRNIYRIIASLVSMSQDCPDWTKENLQSASSAGPFKYGFVFKDVWGDSGYISKLQGCISKLTGEDSGSLQKLKTFFSILPHRPPPEPPQVASSLGSLEPGVWAPARPMPLMPSASRILLQVSFQVSLSNTFLTFNILVLVSPCYSCLLCSSFTRLNRIFTTTLIQF